jgi:hypothetical protein
VPYTSPFLTTLKVATAGVPDETVLSDLKFCHQYDNGTHALLPLCGSDSAPTDGHACFFAKWDGTSTAHDSDHSGDADDADGHLFLVFDVWDFQNGGFRGQF